MTLIWGAAKKKYQLNKKIINLFHGIVFFQCAQKILQNEQTFLYIN